MVVEECVVWVLHRHLCVSTETALNTKKKMKNNLVIVQKYTQNFFFLLQLTHIKQEE